MKRVALIPLALLMVMSLMACGSDEEDKAVATVNDVDIKESQWQTNVDQMKKQYQQYGVDFESEDGKAMLEKIEDQALESLIQQEVLVQKAEDEGYDTNESEVEEELDSMVEQYGSEEELDSVLEQNGFTEASFRSLLEDQLTIEAFIEGEISVEVTDEDIEEAYATYVSKTEEQDKEPEALEDIKDQLNTQVEQTKEQEKVMTIIEDTKEEYDIERHI